MKDTLSISAPKARNELRDYLAKLADDADREDIAQGEVSPTTHAEASRLLGAAEAECRKLNRLIVRMPGEDRDLDSIIRLLEIITRAAMSLSAFPDGLVSKE